MNPSPLPWLSRRRTMTLALLATALVAAGCDPAVADTDVVSLDTARAEFEAGRAVLIDIREPAEHATGVAAGAQLLPSASSAPGLARSRRTRHSRGC